MDSVPGRGHSYWMEDEEVGRVYGGPCKAATEHEAAGGRGLSRALARPSSPALTVSPSLPSSLVLHEAAASTRARRTSNGREGETADVRLPGNLATCNQGSFNGHLCWPAGRQSSYLFKSANVWQSIRLILKSANENKASVFSGMTCSDISIMWDMIYSWLILLS